MFDSLEKILLEILEKLNNQEQLLQVTIDSLNNKKSVAKFLGVSSKTISNMIKDGRFQVDREYKYNKKGQIEFVPQGILEYKKGVKHPRNIKKVEKKLHPVSSKFIGASNG